jgi:hypothetical protein
MDCWQAEYITGCLPAVLAAWLGGRCCSKRNCSWVLMLRRWPPCCAVMLEWGSVPAGLPCTHPDRLPTCPRPPLQATTNALLSHFFSLVCSLWLLRIIANRPSAAAVMVSTSSGGGSSSSSSRSALA